MSDLKKCQKALKAKGYDPVFIGYMALRIIIAIQKILTMTIKQL